MNQAATTAAASPTETPRMARAAAALALATVLSALFYYKWSGSLRAYAGVHATGKISSNPSILLDGGPWATAVAYLGKIWPALVYGILIGAVIRAALPPAWISRAFTGRGLRGALVGGIAGAPLMLCSCCVTPVFTGLYERGAKLGSSLAVMLGAPGFNLAALALTFALLPLKLAVARAICAVIIVIALPTLLGRMDTGSRSKLACAVAPEPATPLAFGERFLRSLVYLIAVTVPLIVVGVVLGGLALPYATRVSQIGVVAGIALVALVAVLVALPTFFEIPIALLLLSAGAPQGAALAVLIAGPVVNLPSLLVLGRETRPRLALALAVGVWAVATLAGVIVSA